MLEHRNAGLTDVAVAVTDTGNGLVAYVLAAVAGGVAALRRGWHRRWLGPLVALAGLLGAQLLRQGMVRVIDRPRPPMTDWVWSASGPSFPSGHTTTSTTVAAMFCLALLGGRDHPRLLLRRAVSALAVLWAAGVGVTRVYLGVHWPTDVLGGWLLGSAFALTAVLTVRYLTGQSISFSRVATRAAPPERTGR
jgi:membrane-associated phospholipid phosphatase